MSRSGRCELIKWLCFAVFFVLTSCQYNIGQKFRSLPGGYKTISIPVFKNKSMEPGAEAIMTQALREEFFRSTVLKVVDDSKAEVRLVGEIENLRYDINPASILEADPKNNYLPQGSVLATKYDMTVLLNIKLIKINSGEILWQSQFSGTRSMDASQITVAGVNSANPIYNQGARRIVLENVSYELSNQIHNNMTENF